ncbi:MAG: Major Facilitator Superfamily transporter [Haloplasmataceae bacterium]|jgi:DHA3 family macrolide efflux protein-like MFS transporter|nr:Major Facilitator Superfamily transporter [Haloplasmataceae bacterium]
MNKNWRKNIILFLSTQTISLFGSSLVQYAITWYITLQTESGVMLTIAIICGFLPTFFISPFAGVWADRYNRKILIIVADSLIAISTLILALLFLSGYNAFWLLFVILTIRAIGSGIQSPAVSAILPQIVPAEKLTRVSGINGAIQSIILLISPALSGFLLFNSTIETIFFIDVVTAAIAVFILLTILRIPAHSRAIEKLSSSYLSDMRAGVNYIMNHDYVKKFFLFCTFFFFLAAPVAFLTPLQVTRNFGDDVWRLTAIEITFSSGMMIGGIIMAIWGGFKNKVHSMAFSSIVMGFCTFLFGFIPIFWLYLFFMGLIGLVMPVFNIPATVLLQKKVEVDYLGRVFGVLGMISSIMMPFGMLVFGPLSDVIRIEWILIFSGLSMFIQGFVMLKSKVLIEAGASIDEKKE